ncbi:MAG: NAD(P)-dependent oxidoreductase [Candidatus Omnitrophota bacterium]
MVKAVIGTGIIGTKIAEILLKADGELIVFNRTKEKAGYLKSLGACVVPSVEAAVNGADCIILTLADKKGIDDSLFFDQLNLKGKLVLQMGTISPEESIEISGHVKHAGGDYLECPILGSRREIEQKCLIMMVGGDQLLYKKWGAFFSLFGQDHYYIGKVGQAAALKLAINQIIASHAVGFSLSLGMVEKNNIDINMFMDILKKSSLYATMFEKKMANWSERKYSDPNFSTKHLLKDVGLIVEHAKTLGLRADIVQCIGRILQESVEEGLGDSDYSAVFNTINRIE